MGQPMKQKFSRLTDVKVGMLKEYLWPLQIMSKAAKDLLSPPIDYVLVLVLSDRSKSQFLFRASLGNKGRYSCMWSLPAS